MDKKLLTKYISAFMLGDGCLRIFKNGGKNAAYSFSQVDKHKEYTDFQDKIISQVTGVTVRHYDPSCKDGINRQGYYKLESRCHPFLTTIYSRWYNNGRKTISLHDLKQFDWETAAIWYMDDGYILNSSLPSHNGNVFLCTDGFSEAEVTMLQKIIFKSLGVSFDVIKRGYKKDGTRIYRLRAKHGEQATTFLNGVSPFIFESFKYKLRTENPTNKVGDDIVCTTVKAVEKDRDGLSL